MDCFACFYNAKLPKFFSRFWNPGTAGVDAFAQKRSDENALLVPPVVLIPSVVSYLHSCRGKGTLVFPWWPSNVLWPLPWSCYRPWIKYLVTVKGSIALKHERNTCSLLGSRECYGFVGGVKSDFSVV